MLPHHLVERRAGGQHVSVHQQEGVVPQFRLAPLQPRTDPVNGVLHDVFDVQAQVVAILEVPLNALPAVVDHDQDVPHPRFAQGGGHVFQDGAPGHANHGLGPGFREGHQPFRPACCKDDRFHKIGYCSLDAVSVREAAVLFSTRPNARQGRFGHNGPP